MKRTDPADVVTEMKTIESRLSEIDAEIENIYGTPSAWTNFFSGFELKPTPATKRKISNLSGEEKRLNVKFGKICKLITMEQAEAHGYCCDCCEPEMFADPT